MDPFNRSPSTLLSEAFWPVQCYYNEKMIIKQISTTAVTGRRLSVSK